MKIDNNNKAFLFTIFIVLIFIFNASSSCAQELIVSAKLDTNQIKIGKQAHIKLEATAAKGIKVFFPNFKDTITDKIELVKVSKIDTFQAGNQFTYSRVLTITSFDSGYYAIPPFKFQISNDSTKQFETEALLFSVQTVAVDTTLAIKAIKGPVDPAWSIFEIKKEILIGLLALIAIVTIIYFLSRKKKIEIIEQKPEVKRPAHEIAIESLNELKNQKLWQQGRVKEYHIFISDIVRTYIENRYAVGAMEMTSEEILKSLRLILPEASLKIKLSSLLILSDMVKFAKENPLPNENEMSWENAIAFVKETALSQQQGEVKS